MGILERRIKLPAVKRVQLVIDDIFIRRCLKKRRASDIKGINFPEALKAIVRDCEKSENELLHIISCCNVALENISTYKKGLEKALLRHTGKDYI